MIPDLHWRFPQRNEPVKKYLAQYNISLQFPSEKNKMVPKLTPLRLFLTELRTTEKLMNQNSVTL